MASHRFLPLLLAFGLSGAAELRPKRTDLDRIIKFDMIDSSILEFELHLDNLYGILGPGEEPTLCMQLETNNPVTVLMGCDAFTTLGVFGSQLIPLNQTFLEHTMGYDREEAFCDYDRLPIRIQTHTMGARGFCRLYKCTCTRTNVPYKYPGSDFYTDTTCEPFKNTWEDRSKEIRFYHNFAEVQREKIQMDHTIQAAIVDFQHTMCFTYKGDGLIQLTLSKCQDSQNITIILNSDRTYSFSNKQKEILKKMHEKTCSDGKEDWWLDIETFGKNPIFGYVNVFGCQRYLKEGETDDEGKPFKDILPNSGTTLDGISVFFDLKQNSTGVYSTDIKDYLDQASVVKNQSVVLGVNITSTSPITLVLTRCKYKKAGKIVIAKHINEGYLSLNYTELQKYKELSVRQTCDSHDEDDALYLHIITYDSSATGSVTFSLDETVKNQKPFSTTSFPRVSFAMANDSAIVKKLSIGDLFILAYQANKRVFFNLEADLPVSIYISKCRYSRREMVAGVPSIGSHQMTTFIVTRITRATSHRCGPNEDIGQDEVYVHFESHLGPVQGTFGFFAVEKTYQAKPMLIDFVPLDKDRRASDINVPFEIATKDPEGLNPVEVDITALVQEAYFDNNKNVILTINRETKVSLYFSKCQHSHNQVPVFNFTGAYILNHHETAHLLAVTKRVQCDNVAQNGVFLHVSDPTENDVVTVEVQDFRLSIPNNGGAYSAKEKEPHTVEIPLAPMDHGVSIRITNVHSKSVDLHLTMCPSLPEANLEISNGTLTTAHIKLDVGHLKELKEKAKNCPTPLDYTLYFIVVSPNAKGLITVERSSDEECDKFECSMGAVKYFNDTSNLIIA